MALRVREDMMEEEVGGERCVRAIEKDVETLKEPV
jgi:hypothetical protein